MIIIKFNNFDNTVLEMPFNEKNLALYTTAKITLNEAVKSGTLSKCHFCIPSTQKKNEFGEQIEDNEATVFYFKNAELEQRMDIEEGLVTMFAMCVFSFFICQVGLCISLFLMAIMLLFYFLDWQMEKKIISRLGEIIK